MCVWGGGAACAYMCVCMWFYLSIYQYKLSHCSSNISWSEAEKQCLKDRGNLATVQSFYIYHIIEQMFYKSMYSTGSNHLGNMIMIGLQHDVSNLMI